MRITSVLVLSMFVRATAHAESPPYRMTEVRERHFLDRFDAAGANERWFFNSDWEVRDGALVRNELSHGTTRVFLRDTRIRDAAIRFRFTFRGAGELRLVTGGGGSYNAVVIIRPDHFTVRTGINRAESLYPGVLGECGASFARDRWYTMSVEIIGDELLAHVGDKLHVLGSHPSISRERTYFAFQVDAPGAAFDDVEISSATQRDDWPSRRTSLLERQRHRPPVPRAAKEMLDDTLTMAHDELYRGDDEYRRLVDRHLELQATARRRYPAVFRTNKEAKKAAAGIRKTLLAGDPEFKRRHDEINRAKRAEREHLLSKAPGLSTRPRNKRVAQLERLRQEARRNDSSFLALVERRRVLEREHRDRYPQVFIENAAVVDARQQARRAVKRDPEFLRTTKTVATVKQSIDAYRRQKYPRITKLEVEAGKRP